MSAARGWWLLAGLVASLFPAVPASAAGKLKAHLECMSGEPVQSGKAARLTEELWCSIRVDKLGPHQVAELTGHLTLVLPSDTTLPAPVARSGPLADTQDGVEFRLDKPFAVNVDFRACEPFTVKASLEDPGTKVWTETFRVAASCPKPKKVAATLRCHYTAQDGTVFQWPGTGAKVNPRLEATLSCSVVAPKAARDVTYEVSLGVVGKGTPARGGFERDEAGAAFFQTQFEEAVYEACTSFEVSGEIRANGARAWSGKLPIKQDCGD